MNVICRFLCTLGIIATAACGSSENSNTTHPEATATSSPSVISAPMPLKKRVARKESYIAPAPVTRAEMRAELETAESLLSRAEIYADNASSGQSDDGWYEDDRRFQSRMDSVAKRINMRLARTPFDKRSDWDSVSYDISANLLQAESFLFGAVQSALAACNEADAKANLRVARADIKEARRDFDKSTRDPDNWSPPEINPSGEMLCNR
ncbi:MAG: hypothetical protein JWM87_3789 [Candidatus Eremiobacteraeota bacterium]|nr:hypothetical protein [Candidatus Eremiobacteraeota bacterium]